MDVRFNLISTLYYKFKSNSVSLSIGLLRFHCLTTEPNKHYFWYRDRLDIGWLRLPTYTRVETQTKANYLCRRAAERPHSPNPPRLECHRPSPSGFFSRNHHILLTPEFPRRSTSIFEWIFHLTNKIVPNMASETWNIL